MLKLKGQLLQWRHVLESPTDSVHVELAQNWSTCAVGEKSRNEGRLLENPEQLTPEAKLLGIDFWHALKNNKKSRAVQVLDVIENIENIWKK